MSGYEPDMSQVTRYDSYGYDGLSGLMKEHPEGEWVRIESYELAALERDTLRTANQRLEGEVARLREAYRKMRNVAAGYSNLCESDSANARRLEREFEAADAALAGDGGDA